MKALLLDGKEVSARLKEKVTVQVTRLKSSGITPRLVVILVGDDPASAVYVRNKARTSEKLGIQSETITLKATISEKELLACISKLNRDDTVHGILVQLPLPQHINSEKIIEAILPDKDVDCFHPRNVGLLMLGKPYLLPCTPAGIVEILKYYKIETSGKHVVILGRSNIVGKPMANMLVQKSAHANATVTVVHSRTKNIKALCLQADILIAAIGKAAFVTADMVREDAVVIDVGINRVEAPDTPRGYKIVGDVDFIPVSGKAAAITPVPGGVGPMTIAMLMQNTVTAAKHLTNFIEHG
ncbi:MAG TPA: bifunctional methylenetetrahydrofolate dehydrogenase/methenyltetrahydrofolate cyclohydrolase FolD [Caldithrix abyssi]|uniref:Bifunctional protein FolD n=1 Tax=Caldithrix abyssi TaxID=187145 RepID=A0A7V5VEL8_CALAY|nr:bifunctional methylenetetrahydrofolate dehydrogenase/methenyltetrahydrofolate cyclohydrolase FolD [Caldithrix abyssi]